MTGKKAIDFENCKYDDVLTCLSQWSTESMLKTPVLNSNKKNSCGKSGIKIKNQCSTTKHFA